MKKYSFGTVALLFSLGSCGVNNDITSADQPAEAKKFRQKTLSVCTESEYSCGNTMTQGWSCAVACEKDVNNQSLLPVRNEAGFYEISRWNTTVKSRIFYSFQHANQTPESKPLLVLTNGGPIVGTTGNLLVTNTGLKTIFENFGASNLQTVPIHDNPDSWTRFSNLLYIDAPGGGFSYDKPMPSPYKGPFTDAAAVVSVLLRFLETHTELANVPIVLVGESYGGARTALMMQMLLHPDRLRDGKYYDRGSNNTPIYTYDTALATRIEQYVQNATGIAPTAQTPEVRAKQFVGQILIQPAMPNRKHQDDIEMTFGFDNSSSTLWQSIGDTALENVWAKLDKDVVVDPADMSEILTVDISDISWFYANQRGSTHRGATNYSNCTVNENSMALVFGALPPANTNIGKQYDCYYLRKSKKSSFDLRSWNLDDNLFIDNLLYTKVFMTSALEDRQIITLPNVIASIVDDHPSISSAWATQADTVHERPGYLNVQIVPHSSYNSLTSSVTKTIRLPQYSSGHMVSMGQPKQLADDVNQWMCEELQICVQLL